MTLPLSTFSTAGTSTNATLTAADIDRMAELLRNMPPEPIGEWMRNQGKPPNLWSLWLPESFKPLGPALWPSYVAFSNMIDRPLIVARHMLLSEGTP